MNRPIREAGLALISTIWISAILGLLSVSALHSFSANTEAAQIDAVRVKHNLLHLAGVRYAALHLASNRRTVAPTATPASELVLELGATRIRLTIENEAGRIDLVRAPPNMLVQMLTDFDVPLTEAGALIERIQSMRSDEPSLSYRSLRKMLAPYPNLYQRILRIISLHNGQAGVHPMIASESVLGVLPGLSRAEQQTLLTSQNSSLSSLVSTPIDNAMFTTRISAFYRITTTISMGDTTRVRTEVIKMTNEPGVLYQRVAVL